jgi:hypothetical protein
MVTALADRMEAMPSSGLEGDRERRDRVDVLRRTAEAGARSLARRRRAGARDGQQHAEG